MHLVEAFRRFRSVRELLSSAEYAQHRPFLTTLFHEPRITEVPGCKPRLTAFLRIVQWNIEYGKNLDAVAEALNQHPVMKFADLIFLNEVDDGVPRSSHVSVPAEMSRRLNAHAVFGVEYLELGSDPNDSPYQSERKDAIAKSAARLHGCAILARHPFNSSTVVRLPRCEDNFRSTQKRLGGRAGIIINLMLPHGELTAATAHLDVVNTPRCRQSQTRALLRAVQAERTKPGRASGPPRTEAEVASRAAIVGGDLNTHTFARGGHFRAAINLARILAANRDALTKELLNPLGKEPLLREFAEFGYDLESFNDRSPTNQVGAEELGASSALPRVVRQLALNRLGGADFSLPFRLDWIAGSGLTALSEGEVCDPVAGAISIGPTTVSGLRSDGRRLSDHDPIVVDVRI